MHFQSTNVPLSHFHRAEAFPVNLTYIILEERKKSFPKLHHYWHLDYTGQLRSNSLAHKDGIFSMRGIPHHILHLPAPVLELRSFFSAWNQHVQLMWHGQLIFFPHSPFSFIILVMRSSKSWDLQMPCSQLISFHRHSSSIQKTFSEVFVAMAHTVMQG